MAGKQWSPERRLAFQNKKLSLENASLKSKVGSVEGMIHNSLGGLAQGLGMGAGFDNNGFGMSNLTSLNPTLQNNQYAPITLMWTMLQYMYKTHGLVQTAIDMPVLDALRGGLEYHSEQLDATDLQRLEDYMEENAVLERIGDAFIWARLFGGSALIINTEVGDHEEELGDELMGRQIEFYDACRWELTCERRIPKSGLYGFYGKQLHSSRVITILGKRAPWLLRAQLSDWGMSELERVIESFNLWLRTNNVIYEILDEAKLDVYQLTGFKEALATSNGTALTTRRIQTMNQIKNFNNALVLDVNDKYETKQLSFGGLAEIKKESRMEIAAAFRMPMSKLFGIPSTGFSSGEDDVENYNGLVESEVRQPMKQVIRKVLKLVVKHVFHDDLDISFKFKPLRILSSSDEETIRTSKSNRYLAMFDKMLMSSKEVGEAMQKDNIVPIPIRAEKGLLEDHPTPTQQEPVSIVPGEEGSTASEQEAKGELLTEQPPLKLPSASAGGKLSSPKKPESPEKPKLNRILNVSEEKL